MTKGRLSVVEESQRQRALELLDDEQRATVRQCVEMVPSFEFYVRVPLTVVPEEYVIWYFEHGGHEYADWSPVREGRVGAMLIDAQRCIEVVVLGESR